MNIFDYLLEPLHWFSKDIPIFDSETVDYLETEDRVLPNIIRTDKQYNTYKVQSTDNVVTSFYIGRVLQDHKPKKRTP